MNLNKQNTITEYLRGVYYPKTKLVMIEASKEHILNRMQIAFYQNTQIFNSIKFKGNFTSEDLFEVRSIRGKHEGTSCSKGSIYSNKKKETFIQLKTETGIAFKISIFLMFASGLGATINYVAGNGNIFTLLIGILLMTLVPIVMIGYAKGMVIALEDDFIEYITRKEKKL